MTPSSVTGVESPFTLPTLTFKAEEEEEEAQGFKKMMRIDEKRFTVVQRMMGSKWTDYPLPNNWIMHYVHRMQICVSIDHMYEYVHCCYDHPLPSGNSITGGSLNTGKAIFYCLDIRVRYAFQGQH